jgi:hypothetical protein
LRRTDIVRLFFFHYPVRCRLCHEREYVDLLTALRINAKRPTSATGGAH